MVCLVLLQLFGVSKWLLGGHDSEINGFVGFVGFFGFTNGCMVGKTLKSGAFVALLVLLVFVGFPNGCMMGKTLKSMCFWLY
jgi:hypothetical protein